MTGFVTPAYGTRSLCDVVPAVGVAIGTPLPGEVTALSLPPAPSYVVLLVDGLGWEQLDRYAHAAPFLADLMSGQEPGTATVPSTTATSLTSLGTGLAPGRHGVVGFTSRIPGTDRLLNALFWDRSVDPVEWQPHDTAFERLQRSGARVHVVNKRDFAGSGLTTAAHRGGTYVPVDRVGERIAACVDASATGPSFTYAYEGDLDWTGHRYGVASTQWLQQLAAVDAQVEQLREALPDQVRLLIVSDHGMIDSSPRAHVDIDLHPPLRDGVALLGGEARFRHLYCRRGAVQDVVATWSAMLGDRAVVLPREDAFESGWFGAVTSSVLPRIGDVVVAARADLAVMSSVDFDYEMTLVGLHGSLTSAEMLIPMLLC